MNIEEATHCFKALSQQSRLRILQALVSHGQQGCPAGRLGKLLQIPNNTLSFHLNHLSRVNLIQAKKQGRQIIYSVCYNQLYDLKNFFLEKYEL